MSIIDKIKDKAADLLIGAFAGMLATGGLISGALYYWWHDAEITIMKVVSENLTANPYNYKGTYGDAIRTYQTNILTFAQHLIDENPEIDSSNNTKRDVAVSIARREFKHAAIKQLTELLSHDDSKKTSGNAEDNVFIKRFKRAFDVATDKNVSDIDQNFIGYAQYGTLLLEPEEDLQKRPDKGRSSAQSSFKIFASKKAHVYIEFTIGAFETSKYDVRLLFFNQIVCSDVEFEVGPNSVEFQVEELNLRGMNFDGVCNEVHEGQQNQNTESINIDDKSRLRPTNHNGQIIPVQLRLVSKGSEPLNRANLDYATKNILTRRVRSEMATPAPPPTTPPTDEILNPKSDEPVHVVYTAIVSPLIEDYAQSKKQNHSGDE